MSRVYPRRADTFEARDKSMGIFTAVKAAVVGDDAEVGEESANDLGSATSPESTTNPGHANGPEPETGSESATNPERPTVSDKSVSEDLSGASCSSEIDFVVATGQTRNEALLELVEAHGGRVKQVELVELTGWSKATVSRRLGQLEDEGAIDRVPVGRCKIVLLPGESLLSERAVSYGTRQ